MLKDVFKVNYVFRNMIVKVVELGLRYYFYICCFEYFVFLDYFKCMGYRNVGDEM